MQLLFSNWVIPLRLERKTYCLEGSCSIQLSYGTDLMLSQKRCKDSANRMKFQIYLRISEVQPIFRLQSRLKLCKNRAKKQPNLPFPTAGDLKVHTAKQDKDSATEEKYTAKQAKVVQKPSEKANLNEKNKEKVQFFFY